MTDRTSRLVLAIDGDRAKSETDAVARSLDRVTDAGDKASASSRAVAASYRIAATAAAGYISALSVGAIVNDIQRLQGVNSRLAALTGDLAGQQQFLRESARELSTEYVTLADGYSRVLTLYDSGLLTLQQSRDVTTGLANVAAEVGAGQAALGQAIFGLSQGLSAGVLRAEELNQVTEPLPGLLNRLDEAAGLAAGGFRKLVNEGKVTSELFSGTLLKALETYDGAAAARSQNLEQTFTRTKNAYLDVIQALEEPISTPLVAGADALTAALKLISDNGEIAAKALTTVGAVAAVAIGGNALQAITAYGVSLASAATRAVQLAAVQRSALATTNAETASRLASAQAAAKKTAATLADAEATAAALPVKQRLAFVEGELAAARTAATTATVNLTAAQNAAVASTGRLTLAQRAATAGTVAFAAAQRTLQGAMALIGGPTGATILAGAGLLYLVSRQSEAEKAAEQLETAMLNLNQAYRENASAAAAASESTIRAQEANLIALENQLNALLDAQDELQDSFLFSRDNAASSIQKGQIAQLEKKIEDVTKRLEEFRDANEEAARGAQQAALLLQNEQYLQKYLDDLRRATRVTADDVAKAYDSFVPTDSKIAEIERKFSIIERGFKQGLVSADQLAAARAASKAQIDDITGRTAAQEEAAKNAEEYSERVRQALSDALPDRARSLEQVSQLKLLRDEYVKGGDDAELYRKALFALSEQFRLENAAIAAEKVRELNDVLSRRVADPFESYRADISLLNKALEDTPKKARQIQLALQNLDLSVVSELTVVESADNEAVLERSYTAQLNALNEFHATRNVAEQQAQENRAALDRSYAEERKQLREKERSEITDFLNQFSELSGQSAGINLQISFDDASEQAKALKSAQERADKLAEIEQAYQVRVAEIVRSGQGTLLQIEQASAADRFAALINSNQEEINAVTGLVDSLLSLRVSREQEQANAALATAQSLARDAEAAQRVFEQTGLETDRILAEQAEKRAQNAERVARREFEEQKKAQIQQARLSQLVAIMNAYATGGNWITGTIFAATAAATTQAIINDIKSTQFDTASLASGRGAAGVTGNYEVVPASPSQTGSGGGSRIIFIEDSRQYESQQQKDVARAQSLQRMVDRGIITQDERNQLDFRNVPRSNIERVQFNG